MKDAVGNKINEGDLIKWTIPAELLPKLVFQVTRSSDGGISTPQGDTPPFIQLTLIVPIEMKGAGGEPILLEMWALRNPNSEALIDTLTGGGKPS